MSSTLEPATPPGVARSAVISDDGVYRYELSRVWDAETPPVLFVGLNPSTADATEDDPTIRRCVRFARDWGYGGLLMGNLFAYRSTDPKELDRCWRSPAAVSPVGAENDEHLRRMGGRAGLIVAAWGANPMPGMWTNRPGQVQMLLGHVHALGFTKDGHPRHPLYIKADTRPVMMPAHVHEWGEWVMYEGSVERRWCQTCGAEQWD